MKIDKQRYFNIWGWLNLHERQLVLNPSDGVHRIRLHYLPKAKRYPTTQGELDEIKKRIFELLTFLEIHNANILLKQYDKENNLSDFGIHTDTLKLFRTIVVDDKPSIKLRIFETRLHFDDNDFGILIEKITQDFIPEIYIISGDYQKIICVYDGGIDVYADEETTDLLKTQFRGYLSQRNDML